MFDEGMALRTGSDILRMGLGYLRLTASERAAARRLFLSVQAGSPERHDVLVALARVADLDGDFATAAGLYRRALALRPDDAVSRLGLGKALLDNGDRDAGEAALRAAVRAAPVLAGRAIAALAAASHGRFRLRPSAAAAFLRAA